MEKKSRFKKGYKVLVCASLGALIVLPFYLLIDYFLGGFVANFVFLLLLPSSLNLTMIFSTEMVRLGSILKI